MDSIERAINENKKISFLYFDYDDKHKKVYRKDGKRYVVSPAYMVWNKDNYYLLCFSTTIAYALDGKDNISCIDLDRCYGRYIAAETDKTGTFIVCVPGVAFRMSMWGYVVISAGAVVVAAGITVTIVILLKRRKKTK